MNFSIKYFFSKCDQIRSLLENFHGKLHFCAVIGWVPSFSLPEIVTRKDCSAHINLDQIHHRRNNWLGPIFFLLEIVTQKQFVLLCLGLEGVTVVEIDPKGRFVYFKVTLSNDRVFCVYAPWGDSTREQLARGCFLERLQNYMKNKDKGNENK